MTKKSDSTQPRRITESTRSRNRRKRVEHGQTTRRSGEVVEHSAFIEAAREAFDAFIETGHLAGLEFMRDQQTAIVITAATNGEPMPRFASQYLEALANLYAGNPDSMRALLEEWSKKEPPRPAPPRKTKPAIVRQSGKEAITATSKPATRPREPRTSKAASVHSSNARTAHEREVVQARLEQIRTGSLIELAEEQSKLDETIAKARLAERNRNIAAHDRAAALAILETIQGREPGTFISKNYLETIKRQRPGIRGMFIRIASHRAALTNDHYLEAIVRAVSERAA